MSDCWAVEPNDRLTFAEIVDNLEEYLTELMNYFQPTAARAAAAEKVSVVEVKENDRKTRINELDDSVAGILV